MDTAQEAAVALGRCLTAVSPLIHTLERSRKLLLLGIPVVQTATSFSSKVTSHVGIRFSFAYLPSSAVCNTG
jgi:uncharacterized membrane protein YjgN (DUF898 family)